MMDEFPRDLCDVLATVAQHAQERPDAVALEGAFANLSYADLQAEVSELATMLAEDAPAAIGLWMDNSPAWVVTDLAAMQAWIPLIPVSPYISPQQIGHVIASSGLELLMTDQPGRLRSLLDRAGIGISDEDGLYIAGVRVHLFQLEHPAVCAIAESVARVIYSAGRPDLSYAQGVCLSLHGLETAAASLQQACAYSAQERHLGVLPLDLLSASVAVYAVLLSGGTCVLPGLTGAGLCGEDDLDGAHFMRAVRQRRISSAVLTPQMLTSFMAAIGDDCASPANLRHLAVVGRSISLSLLQKAEQSGLPAYGGYGRMEMSGVVAINTPQANRPGSAGRPLPHVGLAFSEAGEILLRGALFSGYMGQDEPELVGGFWPSGDFGYLDDDGFLYLSGNR